MSPSSPRELTWIPSVAVLTYNSRRQPLFRPPGRIHSGVCTVFGCAEMLRLRGDKFLAAEGPPRYMPHREFYDRTFIGLLPRAGFSSMCRAYHVSIIAPRCRMCVAIRVHAIIGVNMCRARCREKCHLFYVPASIFRRDTGEDCKSDMRFFYRRRHARAPTHCRLELSTVWF